MRHDEFKAVVEADRAALAAGVAPVGTACCAVCGVPLQRAVTGSRWRRDGGPVCDDCWFDLLGAELDACPVAAPGRRGLGT